ncbi:MAG: DUF5671 domain-containing protein [Chloroflexota bacterium]
MIVARRVYQYGIAFATVWTIVVGLSGLLEVALEAVAESAAGPFVTSGRLVYADRVSYFGALTGIGLLFWTIHWLLAARAVRRDEIVERRSAVRKLYLYGVLFVGGLILTFAVDRLLEDALRVVFGLATRADLLDGSLIPQLAMLVSAGTFWTYHARVVQRDRAVAPELGRGATVRRWCVYGLAFIGLMILLFASVGLVDTLVSLALTSGGASIDNGQWLAASIADRGATMLAGLMLWLAPWIWSSRLFALQAGTDLERDSTLRKVYLYAVLLTAVSWTVWNAAQVLYVLLRAVLIPSEAGGLWNTVQSDLSRTVAYALVFGTAWAYHARVVSREATAATERHRQATIRWIYGYLVAIVGAITFGAGLGGIVNTAVEVVAIPGVNQGAHWWQEQLALYGTMILVGLPVWLIPWTRLQREVVATVARRSLARRVYLFLALGITVLTLVGTGAYTLYQLLRVALGERWTVSNTSDAIDAISAALVAGLLLAYHLRVLQRDAALASSDEAAAAESVPATPTPLLPKAATPAHDTVTLLVVRPPAGDAATDLRERIQAILPPGATVETVQVPTDEVERLLAASPLPSHGHSTEGV